MINPIYKWTLSANGEPEVPVFPIYKDDLAKEYEQESNQEFYRAKLSGKITLVDDDYSLVAGKDIDTRFLVRIYISYDRGETWDLYWTGDFWKTDCEFNADDRSVTVSPNVVDRYTEILQGLEKEFDLISLSPEIALVSIDKRPMIQVYVPGQRVVGCFLSGMWWEQECKEVTSEHELANIYHFRKNKTNRIVRVEQMGTPMIPDVFHGEPYSLMENGEYINGDYKFQHIYLSSSGHTKEYFYIRRVSDDEIMWGVGFVNQVPRTYPIELELQPYTGSGAEGVVKIYIHDISVWSRYVCDVESVGETATYPIPAEDIVDNNRNYSRVTGYYFPDTIIFSSALSTTPTQWGIFQPGQYYVMPRFPISGINEAFPIARATWGRISLWFTFDAWDWIIEEQWRKSYELRHTYPLASVISVLLAEIAPGLTHAESVEYSEFLYGPNPLLNIDQRILLTPKSNVISAGYDQPAQKAPVTLKKILDMLRDCFRCYWFIDDQNRFRIEHVDFFRRGGSYQSSPVVGRDLTTEKVTRNGKSWSFSTSKFQFEKSSMASRYQFGWMDDVTQLFEGYPINIVSRYVNPNNIEQIDVSQFTSDVDYILLNPGEISKDGFVLLSAVRQESRRIGLEDFTLSGYINEEGKALPAQGWKHTDYIEIDANVFIETRLFVGPGDYLAFYSERSESACVGAFHNREGGGVTPVGTRYFRACTREEFAESSVVWYGSLKLPYYNFVLNSSDHLIQNGYVAFAFLQQYYFWDMPARSFQYNGELREALGLKKLKTQDLKFPVVVDPDPMKLIKTDMGEGVIQKMSINLSSRNAKTTLKYDSE